MTATKIIPLFPQRYQKHFLLCTFPGHTFLHSFFLFLETVCLYEAYAGLQLAILLPHLQSLREVILYKPSKKLEATYALSIAI
jgi:hypothetical protein